MKEQINKLRDIASAMRNDAVKPVARSVTFDLTAAAGAIEQYVSTLQRDVDKEEGLRNAREQASAQMDSIAAMVAALECDYDRLEELRNMSHDARQAFAEELAELEQAAGDCDDADDAAQRIYEDPLSVEIRTDWYTPGDESEPVEFSILLCTGGPAVRIVGELDENSVPRRAWLECQDWFTPWTEYHGDNVDHGALLTYCQQFSFEG